MSIMSTDQSTDGHRRLWLAVLMRALRDALLEDDRDPAHPHNFWWNAAVSDKKSIPMYRDRAKFWLLEDRNNFPTVCDHAGLDPVKTRAHIKGILSDAAAIKELRASLEATADEAPSAGLRALLSAGKLRLVGVNGGNRRRVAVPGALGEGSGGPGAVGSEHEVAG